MMKNEMNEIRVSRSKKMELNLKKINVEVLISTS